MEWFQSWIASLGAIGGFIAMTGFSHAKLSSKIEDLSQRSNEFVTGSEVRQLIKDKIEPHKVTILHIHSKIDDLKETQKDQSTKIDRIIEMLADAKKTS